MAKRKIAPYVPATHYTPEQLLAAEISDMEIEVRCAERDGQHLYAADCRAKLSELRVKAGEDVRTGIRWWVEIDCHGKRNEVRMGPSNEARARQRFHAETIDGLQGNVTQVRLRGSDDGPILDVAVPACARCKAKGNTDAECAEVQDERREILARQARY